MGELDRLEGAVQTLTRELGAWARRTAEAIAPALRRLHRAMWDAYRRAGQPYGPTEDGLLRWAREVGEIERHKEEALRIETHHLALARIRERVATEGRHGEAQDP